MGISMPCADQCWALRLSPAAAVACRRSKLNLAGYGALPEAIQTKREDIGGLSGRFGD